MKQQIIKNDGTLGWHLVKYIQEIANKADWQEFVNWFVKNLIIPYAGKENISLWLCKYIGFKKETSIDKVYLRLKEIQLINH